MLSKTPFFPSFLPSFILFRRRQSLLTSPDFLEKIHFFYSLHPNYCLVTLLYEKKNKSNSCQKKENESKKELSEKKEGKKSYETRNAHSGLYR